MAEASDVGGTEPPVMSPDFSRDIQAALYGLGSLRTGQRAYADVDATFTEIPEHERGIPCVTTANGDRKEKGTLSFHLNHSARVYVGFDRANKSRPSWLKAFSETGEVWSVLTRDIDGTITGTAAFDVFVRPFGVGEVILGPNIEKASFLGRFLGRREPNMYLVCVDPR
jgi:hypothetical protein